MPFSLMTLPPVARHTAFALAVSLTLPAAWAQTTSAVAAPMAATATPNNTIVLARGAGGVTVTVADILSELQRAPEATRQNVMAKPEAIQQITNNLLVRRVLAKEAERDGLAKDPLTAAALAIAQDRILSDARLAKLDTQNEPAAAALDAFALNLYKANLDKFDKPAQTRASHILITNDGPEALVKAKDLLAQLRAGTSFEELAKANSKDPGSAARGGDLGFFGAGQMVRPFEDALTALAKPGDLSEPVESQFGYHIIRLEERSEKGRLSFDEVKPQLLAQARTDILNETRVQKVASLNKDFVFETAAIEAMTKPTGAPAAPAVPAAK
jgi:peptidyl-prolyl cis-trans isomerase C